MKTLVLALTFIVCLNAYVVHEWGTFTSVQGSNGKPLSGVHHEEEPLPSFVHARSQNNSGFCKGCDWVPVYNTPLEVTQKLETPVIYFYSPSSVQVEVSVKFPQGIITETYPQPDVNLPRVGEVKSVANGFAKWVVNVLNRDASAKVPAVGEDNIWAPSRRVNSNTVSNRLPESEKHIFYRGLARFGGPVAVKSNETHLTFVNSHSEVIDASWILNRKDGKGFLKRLPVLFPGVAVSIPLGKDLFGDFESFCFDQYLAAAQVSLEVELTKHGLFPLEARAMVDTWSRSYFKNEGLRMLYIAPTSYPDQLLPWQIEPKPVEEKRVYVGRVEILLKEKEPLLRGFVKSVLTHYKGIQNDESAKASIMSKSVSSFPQNVQMGYQYIWSLGRFAEAKTRRVLEGNVDFERPLVEDWILTALTV